MKIIKKISALLLAGALGVAVVSCGNKEDDNYKNGELKVSMPTGIIRTAEDIIAQEKGYFKEEGVKVTGVNIKGPNALTAINNNSNDLDILTLGYVPDAQAIANGYDNLRFIGGTAVEGGALIAKKDKAQLYRDQTNKLNFTNIKNAKLAFAVGEAAWVVTNQYLIENDPTYDADSHNDLDITNLADEQTVALQVGNGQFDVGFLPLEYANMYKDAYNVELIVAAGDLIPEYVCCRQVTSKQKIEGKRNAFLAYEKARIKAWEFLDDEDNKSEAVDIIANYIHKEKAYVENYLYGGITKWSVDPNTKGIINYTEALTNAGVLQNPIDDIASYIDASIYEEAITYLATTYKDNQFYQDKLQLFNDYNKNI